MKGAIAVLIACMMSTALSACAGAPKEAAEAVTDHQNTEETKVSGTESSAEAKAPAKAPAEETLLKATEAFPVDKKKEAKEKALLPELEVTRHVVTLDNLGDTAFEGTYSEAVLTDACEKIYPALSESIRFACVSAAAEVELALATTAQDIEEYGYDVLPASPFLEGSTRVISISPAISIPQPGRRSAQTLSSGTWTASLRHSGKCFGRKEALRT